MSPSPSTAAPLRHHRAAPHHAPRPPRTHVRRRAAQSTAAAAASPASRHRRRRRQRRAPSAAKLGSVPVRVPAPPVPCPAPRLRCAPRLLLAMSRTAMDELGEKGYQKCILDDWAGALAIWDEAIRRYPKEKRFYNNRALCYFHRKEYARALHDARFMTSQFPEYPRGHFREGEILCAMGNYEDAHKCFLRVISLDPTCTEAINELAEVQIQMLCKKGFSRYQAGCAMKIAKDLEVCFDIYFFKSNCIKPPFINFQISIFQEAESILLAGAILAKDSELYLSEDEDTGLPISTCDPREE
ncbi:hypothetical protein ONE63_007927 [Megalurothrips usitatus]|uniref:Uncharacterized protein n=1 Tax=Megalurothrips usitatus TaxID=439358 RepID=A0AAV7XQ56_9NEOP|nr:hypothetical protein ONE63_007927 [Megalurothrips usitatus]